MQRLGARSSRSRPSGPEHHQPLRLPPPSRPGQSAREIVRLRGRLRLLPQHFPRRKPPSRPSRQPLFLYVSVFQEKATKWETDKGIDGLTTNGVLLLHPKGEFDGGLATPGQWVEVSVGGSLYHLRDSRSAPQKKSQVESETNLLADGSLIDLCGATLLWRSAEGLAKGPVT